MREHDIVFVVFTRKLAVMRRASQSVVAYAKAVDGYINYYNNERIQEKQNGCLLQNSERHPCAPNSIFHVSRIPGTYHKRSNLFYLNQLRFKQNLNHVPIDCYI